MPSFDYDLLIVGAGVSGTALFYLARNFTDIARVGLLEKHSEPARVNSAATHNSQTLHRGDIETNYSLEKALKVKRAAQMVVNFATRQPDADRLIFRYPKIVLGVGPRECQQLRERYERFSAHYPNLRLLDRQGIAEIEPTVVRCAEGWRKEELVALATVDEYTAVDYAALSRCFVRQAEAAPGHAGGVHYGQRVRHIRIEDGHFAVASGSTTFRARSLVVCAGGHSLRLAHDLGYGLHYSCLPVAGSYYFAPQVLNGKVYTVQNDRLPFAAIHGDPDVLVPGKTRFGPTALIVPTLERYNYRTLPDFLRVLRFDRRVASVLWDMLRVGDIRRYIFRNVLFEIPVAGKIFFLRDARKIVPSLRMGDLAFAHRVGGVRPQLLDKVHRRLLLGEAKIDTGIGAIFNVTPSPGGTSCLENAEIDMRTVSAFLGATIDEQALRRDLLGDERPHGSADFTGLLLSGEDAA
jgi:malate dehydrogenase (quinone)